jgi:MerR family Zn(II)-responsive transcriptional regulator of zntA
MVAHEANMELSTPSTRQLGQGPKAQVGTAMTVNDLARRVGVAAHVVRYYSQRGFLRPTRNARNAYREYEESDLHRLRFICRAKALGFTLKEIGMILQAADGGVMPAANIAQLVRARALSIQRRNENVQRVHLRVQSVIGSWPVVVDGVSIVSDLQALIDAVAQEE